MGLEAKIDLAAGLLRGANRVVVFSGAGMSEESGIPTFRDPGGIWDQFDPEEVGTGPGLLNSLTRMPDKIRAFLETTIQTFLKARPNPGHFALGTLERMGLVRTIITQNVDNLHQEAGNTRVFEMHGNLYRQRCLSCGRKKTLEREVFLGKVRSALEELLHVDLPSLLRLLPQCETCGSPMRPDVVMFGEQVQSLYESFREAAGCSVMLVLGTSGVVYPAAAIPQKAKESGAKLIEINPGESVYDDIVDVRIPEKSGRVLPTIVARLQHA
jgi:NAD-dependent deacetylase